MDAFKLALTEVASQFEGVTGRTTLDDAGDRADPAYDVWAIQEVNGQRAWQLVSSPTTIVP